MVADTRATAPAMAPISRFIVSAPYYSANMGSSSELARCSGILAFFGSAIHGLAGYHADDLVGAGLGPPHIPCDHTLADHDDAVGHLEGLRHDVGDDHD